METKNLFELPGILFNQFLSHLGVTDIKSFVLNYQNENVNCLYATLPRHGEYENPTLVLKDLRGITDRTEVVVLNEPPILIRDNEVNNLRNYTSIYASSNSNNKGGLDISLSINMPYCGRVTIGDPFTRFSFLYTLELSQRADELFRSKQYDWIKQYKKDTALV